MVWSRRGRELAAEQAAGTDGAPVPRCARHGAPRLNASRWAGERVRGRAQTTYTRIRAVAQVHHVVPMKDLRCCPWGTSSNKNAAVISTKLNRFFTNNNPPADEVKRLNDAEAYTP